jgi:hypothetical protein
MPDILRLEAQLLLLRSVADPTGPTIMSAFSTAIHHQTYPGLADVMAAMRFIKQHHLQATVGHCGVFTRKRWDQ